MPAKGDRKVTPERLKKICDEYIAECKEEKLMPLDAGLAARLHISKQTVWEWHKVDEFKTILEEFDNECETMVANSERRNAQLVLKVKHGYTDKTEINLGEQTVKEIEKITLEERQNILNLFKNVD